MHHAATACKQVQMNIAVRKYKQKLNSSQLPHSTWVFKVPCSQTKKTSTTCTSETDTAAMVVILMTGN
jgi:hypothetical protein